MACRANHKELTAHAAANAAAHAAAMAAAEAAAAEVAARTCPICNVVCENKAMKKKCRAKHFKRNKVCLAFCCVSLCEGREKDL